MKPTVGRHNVAAKPSSFHWRDSWPYLRPLRNTIETNFRWWWTPWTYRFGHGGWVYLSIRWVWRFRNGVTGEHMQASANSAPRR